MIIQLNIFNVKYKFTLYIIFLSDIYIWNYINKCSLQSNSIRSIFHFSFTVREFTCHFRKYLFICSSSKCDRIKFNLINNFLILNNFIYTICWVSPYSIRHKVKYYFIIIIFTILAYIVCIK